jgi:hypothetical protein
VIRDQTAVFISHIREHAPRYYPTFLPEQLRVQLLSKQERPSAVLYRFKVSSDAEIRSVFVKVPLRMSTKGRAKGSVYEKPQLFPKTEPRDMHWLQYTALRAIDEYFTGLEKKHLGAIRVLDYLPQYHAIFTEESIDPRLRQLFYRENRLRTLSGVLKLRTAFQNVGIWLRAYHTMPKYEDVKIRHENRMDYIEAITTLTDFLAKSLKDETFLKETASVIISKAPNILPESLPLGLGHGDYAMRNILIGHNSRVTVLDTFAKWRTPIYEDIGYFLNELKTSYPQVISQGLAFSPRMLTIYEQEFLAGYFGSEPVPYSIIRLYEVLALLDKWAGTIARSSQKTHLYSTISRPQMIFVNRYFKRSLENLLKIISG